MKIRVLKTYGDFELGYQVLSELRDQLGFVEFVRIFKEAQANDGYTLAGAFEAERCVAVIGYRLLFDFPHGRHLYIDDLVVTATERSRRLGTRLLEYVEKEARTEGCQTIRLTLLTERKTMRSFFEKKGWTARSVVYTKSLD